MMKGATLSPLRIAQLPSLASRASDSRRQSEREILIPGVGGKCMSDQQSMTRHFIFVSVHVILVNFFYSWYTNERIQKFNIWLKIIKISVQKKCCFSFFSYKL